MARSTAFPYDRCVFVNCPFDSGYKPILDAMLFAIHDCGFIVRIALEDAGSGQVRVDKIREIIAGCRYSIHDLSRVEHSRISRLPRLNMAFECGLFLGAKYFGSGVHAKKDMLVLDRKPHQYKRTMSDIAGQDGAAHDNDPLLAIDRVRSFLARKSPPNAQKAIPGAAHIRRRYVRFQRDLRVMARASNLAVGELRGLDYVPDLLALMIAWQRDHP